jgi:hypothetical protein
MALPVSRTGRRRPLVGVISVVHHEMALRIRRKKNGSPILNLGQTFPSRRVHEPILWKFSLEKIIPEFYKPPRFLQISP